MLHMVAAHIFPFWHRLSMFFGFLFYFLYYIMAPSILQCVVATYFARARERRHEGWRGYEMAQGDGQGMGARRCEVDSEARARDGERRTSGRLGRWQSSGEWTACGRDGARWMVTARGRDGETVRGG